MKLNTVTADPAGNITVFVMDDIPVGQRAEIAEAILRIEALKAEQVGFRCRGKNGERNRIEMAGGEFCGNASRAFGMLLAKERGLCGKCSVDLEISGCSVPVCADIDLDAQTAFAAMPLPIYVGDRAVGHVTGTLVHLGGIALFVTENVPPDRSFFDKAEGIFTEFPALEAYGVIFLEKNGNHMTPLIKVPAAKSLVWEGSCGSGSIACAVARSRGKEGEYVQTYIQPAGEICASVHRCGGEITKACIGGKVKLFEPETLEIFL